MKTYPKIYTLTPNPALDLSGHVNELTPNEKNYVKNRRIDPGGNGINAARIAHRLGARVKVLGFAGGATGDQLKDLLRLEGLRPILTSIENATRTNVTVTNDSDHQQTRLTFPGPEVSRAEAARLLTGVRKLRGPGILIIGGSSPEGCPSDFHHQASEAATNSGLAVIVDVPAVPLKKLLAKSRRNKLLLIKPNLTELEELAGLHFHEDEEVAAAARMLTKKSALVCVSLGQEGALLVSRNRIWAGRPPAIKAKGSVGAGDSMVGAMAVALAQKGFLSEESVDRASTEDLADVLAWGLAAGAATASTEGTTLGSGALIRSLHRQMSHQS